MPNRIESELRAVQQSIGYVKKKLKEVPEGTTKYELMEKALDMYYEDEQRLLKEIERV